MEQTNHPVLTEPEEDTILGGLKKFAFGIVLFAIAFYFFTTMTNYENGASVSINKILYAGYTMLGKNLTTILLALIGAAMSYKGIGEMIRSRQF